MACAHDVGDGRIWRVINIIRFFSPKPNRLRKSTIQVQDWPRTLVFPEDSIVAYPWLVPFRDVPRRLFLLGQKVLARHLVLEGWRW
jgi:hypothetical protein